MLKRINLKSLLQAKDSLLEEGFRSFLKHYGIEVRGAEIEDLRGLIRALTDVGCGIAPVDKFYVGYKIPQIGKEFDLLRFDQKSIVNIELKSKSTEEKIKKQLLRNKYYLSFIGRKIYAFTYVSESGDLYFLQDDGDVKKVKIGDLLELLAIQDIEDSELADALFNPSDFLVSPFNSTSKFLAGEYFLTKQQEEIKTQILDSLAAPEKAVFISVIGSAGTGKTLLTYDVAMHLLNSRKKVLVIHCGQLNHGHQILIENGWKIIAIKFFKNSDFNEYDLIVIDESQRIYPSQLDVIIEKVAQAKCSCIFSYDKRQTLAHWEEKWDVSTKISSISSGNEYKLSEKIRTNKEIAAFMKMLFDKSRSLPLLNDGNIEINYFNAMDDARSYVASLDSKRWEVLRFTPSQYDKEHHEDYSEKSHKTSHQIIGQEFEGVVVMIDRFFSYADDGNLIYRGRAYYDPPKMLFQNITRSRKRLNILIIGNEELLNRCIAILH